ncbi:MAG: GIY-YIG nuclease family protein [Bacteroidetes bacterium]|nr:GIY-YIG nuclease family protein [Bacteroidota bacterium]
MEERRSYFVYLLASKKHGTLYTGVTNNLIRRVIEHREKLIKGFTAKYNVNKLVYFESFTYVDKAINREKCIKEWHREWKIRLIETDNKEWRDLIYDFATEKELSDLKEVIIQDYNYSQNEK